MNWNAARVSLDLCVKENASVLTMQLVTRKMVHATVSQDGSEFTVKTPALLGTTAKTVSQNAGVRMEGLVTLLMANVHV